MFPLTIGFQTAVVSNTMAFKSVILYLGSSDLYLVVVVGACGCHATFGNVLATGFGVLTIAMSVDADGWAICEAGDNCEGNDADD